MSFHMKFSAAKLGCPSRNIVLDRNDTHSNWTGGACAMKLAGFDDEIIRKMWRCLPSSNFFLVIHPTEAIGDLSRYGNQNEQDFNIYKHGRVSKSYRVRISYSVRGEALSKYLPPSRRQLGAAQRLCCGSFLFFISVIAQKTYLYIAPTQTRDIAWCPGLTHPRHHNITSVYLGVLNECHQCIIFCVGPHNIRRRCVAFVLPSLDQVH